MAVTIMKAEDIKPKPVQIGNFRYQKCMGEGRFLAVGHVDIPVGGDKPSKEASDNAYVSAAASAIGAGQD